LKTAAKQILIMPITTITIHYRTNVTQYNGCIEVLFTISRSVKTDMCITDQQHDRRNWQSNNTMQTSCKEATIVRSAGK